MAVALTPAWIRSVRPDPTRYEVPDAKAKGLYLVVFPSGKMSWVLRFVRPGGRRGKLTLGPVDLSNTAPDDTAEFGQPQTLSSARALAAKIEHQRSRGVDPVEAYKVAKGQRQAEAANVFGGASRLYIEEHARPKLRQWRTVMHNLGFRLDDAGELTAIRDGLADRWRDRPLGTIDEAVCRALVADTQRSGIPGVERRKLGKSENRGRHMHTALSGFFSWAVRENLASRNPLRDVYKPKQGKRDRVLTNDEIKWFWAGTENLPDRYRGLYRTLLLTGQRVSEVAGMSDSEITEGRLNLVSSRTKNHLAHEVFLADQVRAIIKSLPRLDDGRIFTSNSRSKDKYKKRLDAAMVAEARKENPEADIPAWWLHDLRRTAVTGMVDIGVLPHVAEAAVNHISGHKAGVAGVYNKAAYRQEKIDALTRWADRVEQIVGNSLPPTYQHANMRRSPERGGGFIIGGGNVVPIRSGGTA